MVVLDGDRSLRRLDPTGLRIYWGAHLDSAHQVLASARPAGTARLAGLLQPGVDGGQVGADGDHEAAVSVQRCGGPPLPRRRRRRRARRRVDGEDHGYNPLVAEHRRAGGEPVAGAEPVAQQGPTGAVDGQAGPEPAGRLPATADDEDLSPPPGGDGCPSRSRRSSPRSTGPPTGHRCGRRSSMSSSPTGEAEVPTG